MQQLIILVALLASTLGSPMYQTVSVKDDGSYRFAYETGKEGGSHSRTEERNSDGVVIGKYSYEDPNGSVREVSYRADNLGYVANGDVSVEGAPKGQFPAIPDAQPEVPLMYTAISEVPEEPQSEQPEQTEATQSQTDEESPKDDDIQDLPLDDSSANDPPEAFPEGYFLQHFQGLRRLPEPKKEETSSTIEPSTETSSENPPEPSSQEQTVQPATESSEVANEEQNKISRDPEMELFMHLRPFQSFHPPQWSSSMFHQPVYVFAYKHPESYGYHYYY